MREEIPNLWVLKKLVLLHVVVVIIYAAALCLVFWYLSLSPTIVFWWAARLIALLCTVSVASCTKGLCVFGIYPSSPTFGASVGINGNFFDIYHFSPTIVYWCLGCRIDSIVLFFNSFFVDLVSCNFMKTYTW